MNNLATLYGGQGHYDKTKPLSARAVQGAERILGPEHPNTLKYKRVLADIRVGLAAKEGVGAS